MPERFQVLHTDVGSTALSLVKMTNVLLATPELSSAAKTRPTAASVSMTRSANRLSWLLPFHCELTASGVCGVVSGM